MLELAEFKITVGLSDDRSWTDDQIELMIEYMILNGIDEDTIRVVLKKWVMDDDIIINVEQVL